MLAKTSSFLATLLLLIAWLTAPINAANGNAKLGSAKAPLVIRIGITEYQNIEATYAKYEDLLAQLSSYATPEEPVTFTFAIGTYGEVLDWYNNRTIDLAVLSAMPTADLLQAGQRANLEEAYLGDISVTVPKTSSQSTLLPLFGSATDPFTYRPGCIVLNADKEIQSIEDIKRLWGQNQVKFLFVRPYSLSGYIAPLDVLRRHGIDPLSNENQFQFTYQHPKSLELMLKSLSPEGKPTTHYVAFVLDDTRYDTTGIPGLNPAEPVFRKISLPELDSYSIPREIVVANYHQQQEKLEDGSNKFERNRDVMKRLLHRWNAGKGAPTLRAHAAISTVADWRYQSQGWTSNYKAVQEALQRTSLPKQLLYKSNFDDLLDDLARATSPRLALVLSGGGAKCAYQAGAIIEIERKLAKKNEDLRRAQIDKKLDIDLVVGTSGGAINALLVALGITKEGSAQDHLAETWRSFRQQHFLQPSRSFSFVFGICFGLLQTLLIVVAVLLFDRETMNWAVTALVLFTIAIAEIFLGYYFQVPATSLLALFAVELLIIAVLIALVSIVDRVIHWTGIFSKLHHWRQVTIVLMLIFGFLEILIATVAWFGTLVERVSDNHWVEHFWTVVTLISVWAFPYPFLMALLVALIGSRVWRGFDWDRRREHAVLWTAILLLILSGAMMLHLFFKEPSPSESIGIEEAFVQQVPRLVRNTIDASFTSQKTEGKTDLQSLSAQLLAGKLLQRDLVITTSRLPVSENDKPLAVNTLPDDLYFYHHGSKDEPVSPPPDKRFVPLKYNQEKLLDVVIGSSTIYPIFSPRPLSSVWLGNDSSKQPEPITEMRIIDGGFIHNIPIHAARSWGATHIIVIDASPAPQLRDPQHLWDNTVMAFGYLFKQAQASDTQSRVGTFELRPTSRCEKLNVRPVCADRNDPPDPDMDTFDFSNIAARKAFEKGREDVNSLVPLFVRFPGAPEFRAVRARQPKT